MPKTTEFDKRILKQTFYENLEVGNEVTELQVFEIKLNGSELDETVLTLIDRRIPQHILYLLSYERKYKAIIGYKEAASSSAAFKVNQYYYTDWMLESELPIWLEGLEMVTVYENFVR